MLMVAHATSNHNFQKYQLLTTTSNINSSKPWKWYSKMDFAVQMYFLNPVQILYKAYKINY